MKIEMKLKIKLKENLNKMKINIFFIILREFICQKKYKNNVQIDEIQNSEINKSDTNIVIK